MRVSYIAIVLLTGLLALPIHASADQQYENRAPSGAQNLSAGDSGPEQTAVSPLTVTEARRRELMRRLARISHQDFGIRCGCSGSGCVPGLTEIAVAISGGKARAQGRCRRA
jgi:hypothetical protein